MRQQYFAKHGLGNFQVFARSSEFYLILSTISHCLSFLSQRCWFLSAILSFFSDFQLFLAVFGCILLFQTGLSQEQYLKHLQNKHICYSLLVFRQTWYNKGDFIEKVQEINF